MTIRSLTLADFDAVNTIFMQMQNLHIKYRPDLYRKIEKPTTHKAWDYEASLEDGNKIMLGAETDGKIVGFCIIEIRQSESRALVLRTVAHINNIAVDENYRRKGIGKALYLEAVKLGKARGADSVDLKVFSFNESAIAFYKSLGMTEQSFTMEQKI
jgi:ribosomal protein S18 acetylase RimI-like enzyme